MTMYRFGQLPTPTSAVPTPTTTSTPMGTPVPEDCSMPVYRDTTPAVTVDGVTYLGTTCPVSLGGQSLDIPEFMGIDPQPLVVPEFNMCVDWYTFPTMTIFEITFSAAIAMLPLYFFAILFFMKV